VVKIPKQLFFTVRIDTATGAFTNLVENFLYVGGSATYDGISDLDQSTGVYYYSTDFATPFIYSSNVLTSTLLPTISTAATVVLNIHHDDNNKRILSLQSEKSGFLNLVSLPTTLSAPGKAFLVTTFPGSVSQDLVLASAFVDSTQNFYMIAGNTSNNTGYFLSTFNVQNPSNFQSVIINPTTCPSGLTKDLFIQYVQFDSNVKQLVAGVEQFINNALRYWIYLIQPTGSCVAKMINMPVQGIVTCWSYDQNIRTMYFGIAPNGLPRVIAVNVDSMAITMNVVVPAVPSSIQVSDT